MEELLRQSTQKEKATLQATVDHLQQSIDEHREQYDILAAKHKNSIENHERAISTVRMEMAEMQRNTISGHSEELDERRKELLLHHQDTIASLKKEIKDEKEALKAEHAAVLGTERQRHELLKEQHEAALRKSKAKSPSDKQQSRIS